MQYGHIYVAICIMIKLKVMFWKLYTRIYFNVGTFKNIQIQIHLFKYKYKYKYKYNTLIYRLVSAGGYDIPPIA